MKNSTILFELECPHFVVLRRRRRRVGRPVRVDRQPTVGAHQGGAEPPDRLAGHRFSWLKHHRRQRQSRGRWLALHALQQSSDFYLTVPSARVNVSLYRKTVILFKSMFLYVLFLPPAPMFGSNPSGCSFCWITKWKKISQIFVLKGLFI